MMTKSLHHYHYFVLMFSVIVDLKTNLVCKAIFISDFYFKGTYGIILQTAQSVGSCMGIHVNGEPTQVLKI